MHKCYLLRRATCTFLFSTLLLLNGYSQPEIGYMEMIPSSAGLNQPIELTSAPGDAPGRVFIVQKTGEIRIWDNGVLLTTPFLNINPIVINDINGEQGLLSMAFHPQYAINGFFYVYYNANSGNIVVARYQRSAGNPNIADPLPDPATPLVNIPKPFDNHNGGHLQFRIEGGVNYLYFATGDGGSGNDPFNNAQDPASLLGKMLRVDVDAVNPTVETWGRGLRNPFRWSFDRATGDIWIADVGQGQREEVNYLPASQVNPNFGWPCREGSIANSNAPAGSQCDTVAPVAVNPIFDYQIGTAGRSVIGGYVYRGTMYPSLQGIYLLTDYYSNRLLAIQPNGANGWDVNEVTPTPAVSNIASISEDASGELYALSLTGNAVYRLIVPVVTPLKLTRFNAVDANGYNNLSWTSESEQDIIQYIVEYSSDGRNFSPVGIVASLNNGATNNYSFRHQTTSNRSYYRLKIEEYDTHIYSPVVVVNANASGDIQIYPTIVRNSLLNVVSNFAVDRFSITTMSGQEVFSRKMNATSGFFTIDLPEIKKGLYIVVLMGSGKRFTTKFLIE